mgnify:CR=1 FL=1
MHNHKLVLAGGLIVALITGIVLGSSVLGKQEVQDKIGQVHLVEVTKPLQDFKNAPTTDGGTERKLKLFEIPPLAESNGVFVNIPTDFSTSLGGQFNFDVVIESTNNEGIGCTGIGHTINGEPSDSDAMQGSGLYDIIFCDTENPILVYAIGNKVEVDALTQGTMRVFSHYIIH